jgi:integrase
MQGVRDPLRSEPRSEGSPALESGRPLPPLVALDDVGNGAGIAAVAQPRPRRTWGVKSHERRVVAYPDFLDSDVAAACAGKAPEDRLWNADDGMLLRAGHAHQGWFAGAVKRCKKADPTFRRVTPHDLRHTAASLAISAGANVKVVQRMLGHKSAKVTLDTYAALFPDDLDNVTDVLSRQRAAQL